MNILLFVMTMLFLFAALTYARIESYINFSASRTEFVNFMKQTERADLNKGADKLYSDHHVRSKSNSSATDTSSSPQPQASQGSSQTNTSGGRSYRRLNIYPLLEKPKKESTSPPEKYTETYALLKKLIYSLYANKAFFQELERKRPGFVDEILQKMREIAIEVPPRNMRNAKVLANFNFNDEELNFATYKMFKGVQVPPGNGVASISFMIDEPMEDEDDANSNTTVESKEYQSGPGYASLLDFLMYQKKTSKINVYLAGKPLLMAIFDDPSTVNELIQMRKNIYRELRSGGDKSKNAELFKNAFLNRRNQSIPEDMLDFNVSKTQPDDKWD